MTYKVDKNGIVRVITTINPTTALKAKRRIPEPHFLDLQKLNPTQLRAW